MAFQKRMNDFQFNYVFKKEKGRKAVSQLPNDVIEKGKPQEYMSPSPGTMGSVRPGDDIMLTGRRGNR